MWLKIKEQRRKPNLNEILKMVITKKRENAKRIAMGLKPKKEKKKTADGKEIEMMTPAQLRAHEVYKELVNINKTQILEIGGVVDSIEKRVIEMQQDTMNEKEKRN